MSDFPAEWQETLPSVLKATAWDPPRWMQDLEALGTILPHSLTGTWTEQMLLAPWTDPMGFLPSLASVVPLRSVSWGRSHGGNVPSPPSIDYPALVQHLCCLRFHPQRAQAIQGAYLIPVPSLHGAGPDGQDPIIGPPLSARPSWLL
eukprot:388103-Amphidinium_carterae.1